MRTASSVWARKFRDVVARIGAAFRAQREIEARRALHRLSHLLEQPHEPLLLNEIISVSNEEDTAQHAHGSDARERAAGRPTFERA